MNNYVENRKAFISQLENNSLTILYSGAEKQSSHDECYPFDVNMNFYYVTGIDQENVYLVIEKNENVVTETVFVYRNDPLKVRWVGAYLEKEEVREISGIENVEYIDEFDEFFEEKVNKYNKIYLDLEQPNFKGQVDFGFVLKEKIEKINSLVDFYNAYDLLVLLRGKKKAYEVDILRKAIAITDNALNEVLSKITTFDYEYEVQGTFEGSILRQAKCPTSFHTIAASGKNAAILHYSENMAKMNRSDMILLDLGACYKKYHADISRTYPLSGKFSELQKTIYSIVLGCNKMVIANAKPGVSIRELQQKTVDFLADGMLKAGLMKEKDEISKYYFHGVSHHIGLDTHDPYPRSNPILEEGMIISDEPGLYIEELGIGVRIEDDLLITKNGCENLSKDIIKEIDDIEAFIAKNK